MKFHNRAFPYPIFDVNDEYRDDYIDGAYQVTPNESFDDSKGIIEFEFKHLCSIEELTDLVDEGKAKYGVLMINKDTLRREMFLSETHIQKIELPIQTLHGRVEFLPQIVATEEVFGYSSQDLNEEFGELAFDLKPGDVLATDQPFIRFFEFYKLSFESLISLRTSEDVHKNGYEITLDDSFIFIDMGTTLRPLWDELRTEKDKRPFLAMSIYKDCFFHALYELSHHYDEVADKRWARALTQRLEEMQVEFSQEASLNELNTLAQKLLESESVQKLIKLYGQA